MNQFNTRHLHIHTSGNKCYLKIPSLKKNCNKNKFRHRQHANTNIPYIYIYIYIYIKKDVIGRHGSVHISTHTSSINHEIITYKNKECPHSASPQSQNTTSTSRSPPEDTSCKQNVVVLPLTEITTKKTSTIPLIQLFLSHVHLQTDNVICQKTVELEMFANLQFILHDYTQNTKQNYVNLHLGLLQQPDLAELAPYKN